MRYLILLLFPTLLFAQSPLQGDSWRIGSVNTIPYATPMDTPNIEIPKCLVDGEISQCILMFEGIIFNRSLFPSDGTTTSRVFIPKFRLVVEPLNPKYESGSLVIEVDGTILFPVMYVDTNTGIVAICEVSMLQQADSSYIPAVFVPCGDDIMVPVTGDA